VLAIVAIMLFDVISVVTAKMSVEDQGASAAMTASDTFERTHDLDQARASALQAVTASNPTNVFDEHTFRVDPDGTAHVRLTRQAPTLVAHYVKKLREICNVSADTSGRSTA
jgi:hypothetical protein